MIPGEALEKISIYLEQRGDIVAAYLFGSTVKNKDRKKSDLDLAILFEENMDPYQRFQAKLQVADDLEEMISSIADIADLRSADHYFVHQVMKNKLLLYEGDLQSRVSFEVKHRKFFFDFAPFYEEYYHQSRKRLRERETH